MSRPFLTERQKQILDFIKSNLRSRGVAPTHREICERFGYASYGTVHKHLKLLEQKGYVRRHWNQKRGVELVGEEARDTSRVPFLGVIAAGKPIEAVADNEEVEIPEHLLANRVGDHYVLKVQGDSMIEEGIHDGDLVVVLRRHEARPGEMVVALVHEEEVTLKHFFPEGDVVRLQPANHLMQALKVPAEDIRVQGIVVGLMRKF
ncbi:MAG: transcriptional repressor LexA [Acidobacteriota bacterium]|nr:transcriptional repressor LexA [Acidobacteriota bacterium]